MRFNQLLSLSNAVLDVDILGVWFELRSTGTSTHCFYEPCHLSWCLAERLSLDDSCYSKHTTRCSLRANLSDIHSLTTKVSNAFTCLAFSFLMYAPLCGVEEADDILKALLYFFTWLPSGSEAYWYWLSRETLHSQAWLWWTKSWPFC